MTEELLIGLTVLSIINIILHFRKKSDKTGQDERLKSIENAIIKFDASLEKNEKSVKDELQRNRLESAQAAKENREELSRNLRSFSETNSGNNKELNETPFGKKPK